NTVGSNQHHTYSNGTYAGRNTVTRRISYHGQMGHIMNPNAEMPNGNQNHNNNNHSNITTNDHCNNAVESINRLNSVD
ncbi:unnamed protein product, partial [Schistosoma turkestanicum]